MADQDDNVVTLRSSAVPTFALVMPGTDDPEVALGTSRPPAAAAGGVVQGVDLSGVARVVLLAGRGKTGKTTAVRWMSEQALSQGRPLLMGDLDPTNASFSTYFNDVHRPTDDSPAASLRWLERFITHALQHRLTAVIDLGGGDTTLRRLVDDLPELPQMVQEEGGALALLYHVGPQVDDLAPVAAMEERGFKPKATAIVMNEAAIEPGLTRDEAFARLHRHSVFRGAIGRGAVPVWMPRLLVADAIEARRAHFLEARDGKAGLGPFDRSRVRHWLTAMDRQFAGIRTWLP